MTEIMLGGLIILTLYLLDGGRMTKVADWVREFMEYMERQQREG